MRFGPRLLFVHSIRRVVAMVAVVVICSGLRQSRVPSGRQSAGRRRGAANAFLAARVLQSPSRHRRDATRACIVSGSSIGDQARMLLRDGAIQTSQSFCLRG